MHVFYFGPKINCNPSGVEFYLVGGAAGALAGCGPYPTGGTVPVGTWTHVVYTLDGNQHQVWVNGVSVVGPSDYTGGQSIGIGNDVLGSSYGQGVIREGFVGLLDDVAVWSGVALSASEVSELYAQSQ
jgi:hypothetical protein